MGVRTLPLLFLGNVRNQRFLYVFWREIREKERERERERERENLPRKMLQKSQILLLIYLFFIF